MATKLFAKTIGVAGYRSCGYSNMALTKARHLKELGHVKSVDDSGMFTSRDEYQMWLRENSLKFGPDASQHRTAPFVFQDETFIGGCDDFFDWIDDVQE
jgi:glutaredoxin|eukprot:g656.t1